MTQQISTVWFDEESVSYWVALNQVRGMTPERFYSILDRFDSPESLWKAHEKDIKGSDAFSPAVAAAFLDLRKIEDGSQEIDRAEKAGANIITINSPGYPERLKSIAAPPPVLYVRGEIDAGDEWAVAIVGTRSCSGYGRDAAYAIARDLAKRGYTIVSGLAHGIDTSAHDGALDGGGKTIAVFGTSLSEVYPPANRDLAEEISRNGALVSQFGMDAKPDRWNFPRRNAVISGLSLGTIVVQCAEKSGAMITAELAAEQGREVFAVPGDINARNSGGPHWLLKRGAHLVDSADDVIEILGEPEGQAELDFGREAENEEQRRVVEIVAGGPVGFDEICGVLDKPGREVSTMLMMMEMNGLVRQLPGKIYVKT